MKNVFSFQLIVWYVARFVSGLGDWAYIVVLTYLLAGEGSRFLSLLWIIRMSVPVFGSAISGSLADRINSKYLCLAADFFRGIVVFFTPFFLHSYIIFIFVAFEYFITPIFTQSSNVLIRNMTTVDNRHQVNSVRRTVRSSTMFLGPILGGMLLSFGVRYPFAVQGISYLLSSMAMLILPESKDNGLVEDKFSLLVVWHDIKSAISYIKATVIIRSMFLTSIVFAIGSSSFDAYEVLFARTSLHLSVARYSLLVSFAGLAFVVGGFVNIVLAKRRKPNELYLTGLVLMCIGSLLYTLSSKLDTALPGIIIVGMGSVTFYTASSTVQQNKISPNLYAKVSGVHDTLVQMISTLSVALFGIFLTFSSIRHIMLLCAVIMLAAIPLALSFMSKDDLSQSPTEDVAST